MQENKNKTSQLLALSEVLEPTCTCFQIQTTGICYMQDNMKNIKIKKAFLALKEFARRTQ